MGSPEANGWPLAKRNTFQRMLDLERKHKVHMHLKKQNCQRAYTGSRLTFYCAGEPYASLNNNDNNSHHSRS